MLTWIKMDSQTHLPSWLSSKLG